MSGDIKSILERLAILEGRITPTTVKSGLNPEQKSVPQLPALFKPKHISVLTAKTDPEHPTHDYMVGDSIEHDDEEKVLDEAKVDEEKLLDKVKKSLKDYLTSVADQYKDDSISKKAKDKDLGERATDKDLVARQSEVEESVVAEEQPIQITTGQVPAEQPPGEPGVSIKECSPVKTITFEDGQVCEIHGDKASGFEIRRGNNRLPSRFRTLEQAEMALEMFQARRRKQQPAVDINADYVEEK
jgi:hypothetical protein